MNGCLVLFRLLECICSVSFTSCRTNFFQEVKVLLLRLTIRASDTFVSNVIMIGSSFLSSSSWSSDAALSKEFLPSLDPFVLDIELDDDISTANSSTKWEEQSSSYSGSPEHSFTSEECDWPILGEDIRSILPVTDSLASKLLEEESVIDSLDLGDLDWFSLSAINHDPGSATDSANEANSVPTDCPRKKRKQTKPTAPASCSKSWAKMNARERLKAANALSEIVSQHMSLREQLEVIKMIEPNAVLSPSATEFVINLSNLNDAKLKRICGYLRKRTSGLLDSSFLKFSTAKSKNASSAHRAKRKQKKIQNRPSVTELERRVEKDKKQDEKEKHSGFFVMEKVIRKFSDPGEEEEEVNILE